MRVLFLGPDTSPILAYLRTMELQVVQTIDPLTVDSTILNPKLNGWLVCGFDWIVSHGYRHILKKEVLDLFPERAINCHISYLPWNRGADPNLWSWIDETPKGVTIHFIDPGVDTGDIITQEIVSFSEDETLATSYEKLQNAMFKLFIHTWPMLRLNAVLKLFMNACKQEGEGSFHRKSEFHTALHLLRLGFDTPVRELVGGLKHAKNQ